MRTGRERVGLRGLVSKVRPEILDAAALEVLTEVLKNNVAAEPLLKKTVSISADVHTSACTPT